MNQGLHQYTAGKSLMHRLDPRTRLVTTLAFILMVVATPAGAWKAFALYALLLASVVALSRVSPLYLMKRSLVIVPFVLLVAVFLPFLKPGEVAGSYHLWAWQVSVTYSGLELFWSIAVKAWLSVLSMLVLSSTTAFPTLLQGLQRLGLPSVMVMLLSFMHRYTFVLVEEATSMQRARASRNFGGGRRWHMRSLGNLIGTLFIRSYERGERVYRAMLSRGFAGEVHSVNKLRLAPADFGFGAVFFLYLAAVPLALYLWL